VKTTKAQWTSYLCGTVRGDANAFTCDLIDDVAEQAQQIATLTGERDTLRGELCASIGASQSFKCGLVDAEQTIATLAQQVSRLTEAIERHRQDTMREFPLSSSINRALWSVLTPPAARQGEDTWTQEQIDAAKAKAKRQVALFADQPARPADPVADADAGKLTEPPVEVKT